MPDRLFASLPDETRIWIYAADRPLEPDEQAALRRTLQQFCDNWVSHGRPVEGGVEILDDRFVVVAGLIPGGDISGCGIDASVHALQEAEEKMGFRWLSGLEVLYRDAEGRVQSAPRSAFRKAVAAGDVTAETPVFDVSITTLEAFRSGQFERPAGDSWHARTFRIPAAT